MCVVSNIGDYGRDMWPKPWGEPYKLPQFPGPGRAVPMPGIDYPMPQRPYNGPTKEQFEEFLELLRKAKKFDDLTNQPKCESQQKLDWIQPIADHLGLGKITL